MDMPTGVRVECADGVCGRAKYVILDPTTRTVTHVVVGEPDMLAETRLVPLAYVAESTPELIRLKCTRNELVTLPLFSEVEYSKIAEPYLVCASPELWMGSLTAYWPIIPSEEHRYMPEGELSIRRGTRVEATDGPVGHVDELLVDPASGRITHLVLRKGHLWGQRHVAIPVSEIDLIEQDAVFLRTSKERVNAFSLLQSASKEVVVTNNSGMRTDGTGAGPVDGPRPIQDLVTDLSSEDRTIRENARQSLVEIGMPAVEALTEALAHGVTHVRWEAAKALQQIADPAIAPAMITALEDEDPGVRWIAAEALSFLGRAGAIPLLRTLMTKSDSSWLNSGAHHVLRSVTDASLQKAIAPVLEALEDREPVLVVPMAAHRVLVALEQ